MGSWGAGLYSGDFAMDVRSTVRAVARLPFGPERLADILCESEPGAAANPEDEDHTTFWLVVADQFARRGIASVRVRETALRIIDAGSDLAMQQKLGQTSTGLAKRRRTLAELRNRIAEPPPLDKARATLRQPQPFVMDVGDALAYPTCGGECVNPYFARREQQKVSRPGGPQVWSPDGWAAMVVVERGRAFGFFTWYRPIVIPEALAVKPDLEVLRHQDWRLDSPGTCSPAHFRKMELEKIGTVPVDVATLHRVFPGLRAGDSQAISDISIANRLSVRTPVFRLRAPYSQNVRLETLA
jgi:hypothetical protein